MLKAFVLSDTIAEEPLMGLLKRIFNPQRSAVSTQPIPIVAPERKEVATEQTVAEFLAPLTMEEKVAVSDLSALLYQVVIEFKRTGQLPSGEIKGGVIILGGDTKSFAGLNQVYPNANRGGINAPTSGSITNPSYGFLIDLLNKLSIDDLKRLVSCVDFCTKATLLAESEPAESAKFYQQAMQLNPYDDISPMSYGCLLGMRGNLREGIAWLEKSLKINPVNQRTNENLRAMTDALASTKASAAPAASVRQHAMDLSGYQEPSQLVSVGLDVIRKSVRYDGRFVSVEGAGSEGAVMDAVRAFEKAHRLQPQNSLYHFAWASALHLAGQYKTAEEEMQRLLQVNPQFLLARFAIDGWALWKSHFLLPEWSPAVTRGLPVLGHEVKVAVLLPVLDGITPRATLFLRDSQGDFQNVGVLRAAKIDVTTVVSTINSPQVVANYGCIWDSPTNPYRLEALEFPLRQRGHIVRRTFEFLCLQQDIDFVVIDARNSVLLNKRLPMPKRMRDVNQQLLKLLLESAGENIPPAAYADWYERVGRPAIKAHQGLLRTSDVPY
jgi:tetratricopeptide (TPR) repeat protein